MLVEEAYYLEVFSSLALASHCLTFTKEHLKELRNCNGVLEEAHFFLSHSRYTILFIGKETQLTS